MKIDRFISGCNINVIETLQKIDKCGHGVLYIVSDHNQLMGVVSDGDVRRWIIKTNDLSARVTAFMNTSPRYIFENERFRVQDIADKFPINSLPIINSNKEIVDIVIIKNNSAKKKVDCTKSLQVPCVIMAGGKGTRLYPYTKVVPKPLIPVGDIPILERIFNRFNEFGVDKFFLTLNYKKNMIKSYFDEVSPCYDIVYVEESEPLGTGGGIRLIEEKFEQPILVANCDAIVMADYKDLYDYHISSCNDITIVSSLKNYTFPYGVLRSKENGEFINIEEKPTFSFFINTGMYVISPSTISLIPKGKMYHMTDLVEDVKQHGGKVGMYPISENSFFDMGEIDELRKMEENIDIFSW